MTERVCVALRVHWVPDRVNPSGHETAASTEVVVVFEHCVPDRSNPSGHETAASTVLVVVSVQVSPSKASPCSQPLTGATSWADVVFANTIEEASTASATNTTNSGLDTALEGPGTTRPWRARPGTAGME